MSDSSTFSLAVIVAHAVRGASRARVPAPALPVGAGDADAAADALRAAGIDPSAARVAVVSSTPDVGAAVVRSHAGSLGYGDRDSVGRCQLRPSQVWGTVAGLTTPTVAASKCYGVLVTISDWQTRNPGVVAQSVQRSAFPDRYGQRMTQAASVYAQVT